MGSAGNGARTPSVTVLTTAFNAAPFIAATLDSVRTQTIDDWVHLVVDDASDDETAEIVQRYARDDPRFRLIRRHERGGPYTAANEGLRSISTRYVARLDADDIAVPDRLERSLGFLSDHPGLRACAGRILVLKDGDLLEHRAGDLPSSISTVKWSAAVRTFMPCTLMVETNALRELGGYAERPVAQDHRLICQLTRRRWLGVVPAVLAHWRRHSGQISSTQVDLQAQLGAEIVAEHLSAITGEPWSFEDALALRLVGTPHLSLRKALPVVRRFDRSWRADRSLDDADRRAMSAFVRRLVAGQVKERTSTVVRAFGGGRLLSAVLRARAKVGHDGPISGSPALGDRT